MPTKKDKNAKISRKIKILKKEGFPQKRAVAAAINIVKQRKKKK